MRNNRRSIGMATVLTLVAVVFFAAIGSATEEVLHSFNFDGMDGYQPYSNLVFDSAGNLYGTTLGGGTYGYGVVFGITP